MTAGYRLPPWSKRARGAREPHKHAQGLWALGRSRSIRTLSGRGTMERPWKHTRAGRGGGGSALKRRAVWEGNQREAQGRTGLGKAHRPGSQGGLRKREPGGNEAPTSQIARARVGNSPPNVVRAADLSRPAHP
jgi:hypothetical protein